MMEVKRVHSGDSGFTLLETLVAFAIASMAVISGMTAMSATSRLIISADKTLQTVHSAIGELTTGTQQVSIYQIRDYGGSVAAELTVREAGQTDTGETLLFHIAPDETQSAGSR